MGLQSSRIIWGKAKKNPDDSGYNIVNITDYDPENIYTSGNIVISSESFDPDEEDYHAYKCIAEEAAGDFDTTESWKLLPGIVTLVSEGYIPDTKAAEKIVYTRRYMFKPGSLIIKKSLKDGCHYLYKCIEENNVHYEGWVPEKWLKQTQRVGIAYIPRDHKDVYYDDGHNKVKMHWLMYYMPDNYDNSSVLEITDYSEGIKYFYKERCVAYDNRNVLSVFECISHDPTSSNPATSYLEWIKIDDISLYEIMHPYKKGDMMIRQWEDSVVNPVSEFNANLNYERGQMCLNHITDGQNDVSFKDHEALVITGDYEKEYHITESKFIPLTDYAKQLEAHCPIYGLYYANKDTSYSFNGSDWDLDPVIRAWSREGTLRTESHPNGGYTQGQKVIYPIPESDTVGIYECKISYYNLAGETDWHEPATDRTYWGLLYQSHASNKRYKVYKAVRDIENNYFNKKDWTIVTQNKHDDIGDYGVIWRKYGITSSGDPFSFPVVSSGFQHERSTMHLIEARLNGLYLSSTESVLTLGQILYSEINSTDPDYPLFKGLYFNTIVSTNTGLFGYSTSNQAFGGGQSGTSIGNFSDNFAIREQDKKWMSCRINIREDFPGYNVAPDGSVFVAFYRNNEMLLAINKAADSTKILKITFLNKESIIKQVVKQWSANSSYSLLSAILLPANNSLYIFGSHWIGFIPYENRFEVYPSELEEAEIGITIRSLYAVDINGTEHAIFNLVTSEGHLMPKTEITDGLWVFRDYLPDIVRDSDYLRPFEFGWIVYKKYDFFYKQDYPHYEYIDEIEADPEFYHTIFTSYDGTKTYGLHEFVGVYYDKSDSIIYGQKLILNIADQSLYNTVLVCTQDDPFIDGQHHYVNPYTNSIYVELTNNMIFRTERYAYFMNTHHQIEVDHYEDNVPIYDEQKTYIRYSSGLWELDLLEAAQGMGARSLTHYAPFENIVGSEAVKELYKMCFILDIPYYANQTCHLEYGNDLRTLCLSFANMAANLDIDFLRERDLKQNEVNEQGILYLYMDTSKLTNNPKCANSTGGPVVSDDLIFNSLVTINSKVNNITVTRTYEITVVLPNFRTGIMGNKTKTASPAEQPITQYLCSGGYNAILNKAFFWLSGEDIHGNPFYGGPDEDAQGFSGW